MGRKNHTELTSPALSNDHKKIIQHAILNGILEEEIKNLLWKINAPSMLVSFRLISKNILESLLLWKELELLPDDFGEDWNSWERICKFIISDENLNNRL